MLRKIRNIFYYGGHHVRVNGDYNHNIYHQAASSVDIKMRKEEGTLDNHLH